MSNIIDLCIDFETYYDDEYSLRRMENAEYIMDPRFEIMGVSLRSPGQAKAIFLTGDMKTIHAALDKLPWERIRVVSHNGRFEGSILEWRLKFMPHSYFCTMVGSRPHFVPYCGSQSLAAIADYLGLGKKGSYVINMKGRHRNDLSPGELLQYGDYCVQDTDLCHGIKEHLMPILPIEEQVMIDLTIKKYLRPSLTLDRNALSERLQQIELDKGTLENELWRNYKITSDIIRSRPKFADVLGKAMGDLSKVPTKLNKKNKITYAFAKDDIAFKALLADTNPKVRDLVKAKMTLSSTLEESRLNSLIAMHDTMNGFLPVPLVYYGAHTGRLSGDHGINLQNLPRIEYDDVTKLLKKGHLRFAVTCQEGYSLVAADFSNIEARIVATLAGQWDLVTAFSQGRDIYAEFASKIYGYKVNKKDHKTERFVGKTCILGLGYGMGYQRFHLKMLQEGIIMTFEEARRIVQLYRRTYSMIPELWGSFETLVKRHCTQRTGLMPSALAGIVFAHERMILPNGMPIIYPDLKLKGRDLVFNKRMFSDDDTQYGTADLEAAMDWSEQSQFGARGGVFVGYERALWGGTVLENAAQALAGIIAKRAELKLAAKNLPAALQVHDELLWRVPTKIVDKVIPIIDKIMTEPVDFMPKLPIAVEIHHGRSYGECK